jgi:hypothetical protein
MSAFRVSADDYRLSLQLRVQRLLHGNEEGIQINMYDTAGHETAYKLAHGADKANFSSFCCLGSILSETDLVPTSVTYHPSSIIHPLSSILYPT